MSMNGMEYKEAGIAKKEGLRKLCLSEAVIHPLSLNGKHLDEGRPGEETLGDDDDDFEDKHINPDDTLYTC